MRLAPDVPYIDFFSLSIEGRFVIMHTVEELEAPIEQLPRDEFFHLRDWMTSRFEDLWDEQIDDDIKAGRLDHLAQAALAEFGAGLATPFPVIEVSKCRVRCAHADCSASSS